mmetsp:Transcript_54106/g.168012  ORF Transcript_54106/g.168012 Transcript_54106/m.168012 type:complete len:356 (+) Transcript_54106:22-1089(+)
MAKLAAEVPPPSAHAEQGPGCSIFAARRPPHAATPAAERACCLRMANGLCLAAAALLSSHSLTRPAPGAPALLSQAPPGGLQGPAAPPPPPSGLVARRRLALGAAGLFGGTAGFGAAGPVAAPAAARSAARPGRECACCEIDWCITGCISAGSLTRCDCHAYLSSKGYGVPLDAPAAVAKGGEAEWQDLLGWRSAKLHRWKPLRDEDVEVRDSIFEGAGQGLFALRRVPQWTVLPPYRGSLITRAALARRRYTPQMDYVWCPARRMPLMNMSDEALESGPGAGEPTYCVDSRDFLSRNPARYVNAARSQQQCKAVNVEICEFGQVAYYRTTQDIPVGTELLTEYGGSYWQDFEGC